MTRHPVFDRVSPGLLQHIPYEHPQSPISVVIESDEFTCICPWTRLPDTAHLRIEYLPRLRVVELKSLKYYLMSFRNVGMVHETVVNVIYDHLAACVRPRRLIVELRFGVRGGIVTTVRRESGGRR